MPDRSRRARSGRAATAATRRPSAPPSRQAKSEVFSPAAAATRSSGDPAGSFVTCLPSTTNSKAVSGCGSAFSRKVRRQSAVSAPRLFRKRRRAGSSKNSDVTSAVVPGTPAIGRTASARPKRTSTRCAEASSLRREVNVSTLHVPMLASASPRNPHGAHAREVVVVGDLGGGMPRAHTGADPLRPCRCRRPPRGSARALP